MLSWLRSLFSGPPEEPREEEPPPRPERRHGRRSASLAECLSHFGSPNRQYIAQALMREDLGPVELVHDEPPCCAYAGTGVPVQEHPMCGAMGRTVCRGCESPQVLAIAAEDTTSMSGDTYFNFVVRCEGCGTYSSFSAEL